MSNNDHGAAALEAVVGKARRRLLVQAALRETLLGFAVLLAGIAAMLGLGTGSFPPWLVGLVAVCGTATALVRWRRSRPKFYRVAQRLDARWNSEDQISTAYFFLNQQAPAGAFVAVQREAAGRLAAAGDIGAALPFRTPHTAWAALAALTLAGGLIVARFLLQPTLPLTRPLAAFAPLGNTAESEQAALDDAFSEEGQERSPLGSNSDDKPENQRRDPSPSPEESPNAAAVISDGDSETPEVEGLVTEEAYGDELDSGSLAEAEKKPGQAGERSENEAPSESGPSQAEAAKPSNSWNSEPGSLIDRLKEAFDNMLAQMTKQPSGGEQSQTDQQTADAGQSQPSGEADAKPQDSSQGSDTSGGEASMEGGEASEAAASQQAAQAQGGNSAENSADAGPAAAGSDEGSKEILEQAHREAMGRLEELYSRRAEELRGEVMVETTKAEQTVRTPQQPSDASHTDRGGVLNRDAVPVAYQAFIKSYYESLRSRN